MKGSGFSAAVCCDTLYPLSAKIYLLMCKRCLVRLWEVGWHADRSCSWAPVLGRWRGRPARRKRRLLMTAHEPVTLGSLHPSKLAPRASPASCPPPSASESAVPRAAGASCQPGVTTGPAPGARAFRQPVQIELSVLTVPFEFVWKKENKQIAG